MNFHAQIAPTVPTYDQKRALCVHRGVACKCTRAPHARACATARTHAQTRTQTRAEYAHTHTHTRTHTHHITQRTPTQHARTYTPHARALAHAHARTDGCACVRRRPHPLDGVGVRRGLAVMLRVVLRRLAARRIGRCGAPSARTRPPGSATLYPLLCLMPSVAPAMSSAHVASAWPWKAAYISAVPLPVAAPLRHSPAHRRRPTPTPTRQRGVARSPADLLRVEVSAQLHEGRDRGGGALPRRVHQRRPPTPVPRRRMHEGHAAQAGLGMQGKKPKKDKRGWGSQGGGSPQRKGGKVYGGSPKAIISGQIGQRSRAVLGALSAGAKMG
jgi:hypothetical protein